MLYVYTFLISLSIIISLFVLSGKYSFINEDASNKVRKIHNKKIIKIGGVSFISIIITSFYTVDEVVLSSIYVACLFLVIGLVADLNEKFSSYTRLLISSILGCYYIFITDASIYSINIHLIDNYILIVPLFSFLFTLMCILFLVNGFNIIDGNNGLMLGVTLIIIINLFLHVEFDEKTDSAVILLINNLMYLVIILGLLNLVSGRIISGDAGSYFLGFLIASIILMIFKSNMIDALLVANILFYPVIEMVVSFFRRIFIFKKHPLYPDALHMHSILYKILKYNGAFGLVRNFDMINSITSLIIMANLTLIYIVIYYNILTISYFTYFIVNVFYYIIWYLVLYRFAKSKQLLTENNL